MDRSADGDRRVGRVVARDPVAAGEGGVLGRAVAIDQGRSGQRGQGRRHVGRGQHVAARQQLPQRRQRGHPVLHHRVEQPAGQPRHRHAVAGDRVADRVEGWHRVRQDGQRAAVQQRAPNLQRGGVEPERRCLQHHVIGCQAYEVRLQDEPQDAAAGHHHTLRRAGGAGGVHHVGRVLRIVAGPWEGRCVPERQVQPQHRVRRCQVVIRQDDRGRRVRQQRVPGSLRQARVDRHVGRAHLPHRQHGGDGIRRASGQESGAVTSSQAGRIRDPGDGIGPPR